MAKELILITGATGHLGFRTLIFALQAGYRVRVATRRSEQSEPLQKTPSLREHLESVEFVQVPDITASDAYDEAIKDVDFVLHLASPLPHRVPAGYVCCSKSMSSGMDASAKAKSDKLERSIVFSSRTWDA